MARTVLLVLLLAIGVSVHAGQTPVVTHESTVTATVDAIDRFSRTLTVRVPGNVTQMLYVDPAVKDFDSLQRGDRITVRYQESVVVEVRPGAALSGGRDSTADARKTNPNVVDQTSMVVVIESVDLQDQMVVYRMDDGMKSRRYVLNKALLNGLRAGDRVQVTLTRERAVAIDRARP